MPQIQHKDVGDVWVPQATFTVAGAPTDPTTITVKTRDAAGTITTIGPVSGATGGSGIVRVSPGVFNTLVPLTASGYWYAEFIGTGAAAATEWHEVAVDPSPFTGDSGLSEQALVSVGETKDWLQSRNVNTAEDLDLVRVINDVSARMHDEADREFRVYGANPQVRMFDIPPSGPSWPWYVDGDYMGDLNPLRRTIPVGDLTSFTQVRILGTDWATVVENISPLTKITGLPLNRKPWEPIRALQLNTSVTPPSVGQRLEVTGNWGFPEVPGNVRQATLDAIAAVVDRDVEHYRQDIGAVTAAIGAGGGNTIVIGQGRQRMLSMPPSSLAVAWDYRDKHVG